MGNKNKGIYFFQRLPRDAQEKVIDECIKISQEEDKEYECGYLNFMTETKHGSMKDFLYSAVRINDYWKDIINKYS